MVPLLGSEQLLLLTIRCIVVSLEILLESHLDSRTLFSSSSHLVLDIKD